MLRILKRLKKVEKIKGSMIITPDGMIIISDMDKSIDTEILCAYCSSLCLTLSKSLEDISSKLFSRYILSTDKHKLFIINMKNLFLIIVSDLDIDVGNLNVEIYQVEGLLKKMGRM